MKITQGDACNIPIKISINSQTISPEYVKKVRLCFGPLKKEYPGELKFEEPYFLFPLTQEESLNLRSKLKCEAHIQFVGGDIRVISLPDIQVEKSICKEAM